MNTTTTYSGVKIRKQSNGSYNVIIRHNFVSFTAYNFKTMSAARNFIDEFVTVSA